MRQALSAISAVSRLSSFQKRRRVGSASLVRVGYRGVRWRVRYHAKEKGSYEDHAECRTGQQEKQVGGIIRESDR